MSEFYVGQIFIDDYPQEAAIWCNDKTERAYIVEIEPASDGSRRFQIVEDPIIPETHEQIQARYTAAVQAALDSFAQTRGYDGIMSACSYAYSTDAQFRAEAEYCVTLRDATWRKAYEILDAVMAGTMELPTEEEYLAMLPVADAHWQDEQTAEQAQEGEGAE